MENREKVFLNHFENGIVLVILNNDTKILTDQEKIVLRHFIDISKNIICSDGGIHLISNFLGNSIKTGASIIHIGDFDSSNEGFEDVDY